MRDDALNIAIVKLAQALLKMQPGPLAALRRMRPGEAIEAEFWRLYWGRDLDEFRYQPEDWTYAVHALALVTQTGRPEARAFTHDADRSLGQALHDSGATHLRMGRVFIAPFATRRELLIRATRRLARAGGAFDLRHLARLLLRNNQYDLRRLASDFYQAEARAERKDREPQNA